MDSFDQKHQLQARVIELALDAFYLDRHERSQTFIVFVNWIVPFGVRGVGVFVDEAYKKFEINLRELVASASIRDLRLWLDEHAKRKKKEEDALKQLLQEEGDKGVIYPLPPVLQFQPIEPADEKLSSEESESEPAQES